VNDTILIRVLNKEPIDIFLFFFKGVHYKGEIPRGHRCVGWLAQAEGEN